MNKILILLTFCFTINNSNGQSISHSVLPSQGDYFVNTSGAVSWTLGEISTETYSTSGNFITQGFQQPDLIIGDFLKEIDGNILSIFPNPTFDEVILDLSKMKAKKYQISIYDNAGKFITEQNFSGGDNDDVVKLSLFNYSAGLYHLVVCDLEKQYRNSIKIFKSN